MSKKLTPQEQCDRLDACMASLAGDEDWQANIANLAANAFTLADPGLAFDVLLDAITRFRSRAAFAARQAGPEKEAGR